MHACGTSWLDFCSEGLGSSDMAKLFPLQAEQVRGLSGSTIGQWMVFKAKVVTVRGAFILPSSLRQAGSTKMGHPMKMARSLVENLWKDQQAAASLSTVAKNCICVNQFC